MRAKLQFFFTTGPNLTPGVMSTALLVDRCSNSITNFIDSEFTSTIDFKIQAGGLIESWVQIFNTQVTDFHATTGVMVGFVKASQNLPNDKYEKKKEQFLSCMRGTYKAEFSRAVFRTIDKAESHDLTRHVGYFF